MMISPISAPLIECVMSLERWSFKNLLVNFDGEIFTMIKRDTNECIIFGDGA